MVLDPDQAVEDHRTAFVGVDGISIEAWIFAVVRIPAIDLEFARLAGAGRLRPGLAAADPGIFRQCKFNHWSCLSSFRDAPFGAGLRCAIAHRGIHTPRRGYGFRARSLRSRPGMTGWGWCYSIHPRFRRDGLNG